MIFAWQFLENLVLNELFFLYSIPHSAPQVASSALALLPHPLQQVREVDPVCLVTGHFVQQTPNVRTIVAAKNTAPVTGSTSALLVAQSALVAVAFPLHRHLPLHLALVGHHCTRGLVVVHITMMYLESFALKMGVHMLRTKGFHSAHLMTQAFGRSSRIMVQITLLQLIELCCQLRKGVNVTAERKLKYTRMENKSVVVPLLSLMAVRPVKEEKELISPCRPLMPLIMVMLAEMVLYQASAGMSLTNKSSILLLRDLTFSDHIC